VTHVMKNAWRANTTSLTSTGITSCGWAWWYSCYNRHRFTL